MNNIYLSRYAWPGPLLRKSPEQGLKISIVIPCYNEPGIIEALNSLNQCQRPECKIEVIIVVNHAENDSEKIKAFNRKTAEQVEQWCTSHHSIEYQAYVIEAFDLPAKSAGVGLARKIGMDEAVRRFEMLNEKNGIIVCFDADCTCSLNYLVEIHQHYAKYPLTNVALLDYEHPLQGDLDSEVYEAIINYELHLRYYKNALEYANFPFSHHTIGSCITVSSQAYQKQGGMNKRKAGEDFYFLQKVFPLGHIYEINSATVYPSPRPSDRVPFGTGKAVSGILKGSRQAYMTYNPQIFIELKSLFTAINMWYSETDEKKLKDSLSIILKHFLEEINFFSKTQKIKLNATSQEMFAKSFFQWFNGFTVLKYVHFARDHHYENVAVITAAKWILEEAGATKHYELYDKKQILEVLRKIDRLN